DIRATAVARSEEKLARLSSAQHELAALFRFDDPAERGRKLDPVLSHIFETSGIRISEPFRLKHEQIDGAVHFDGHSYLVEAKWWAQPLEHSDISDLFVKIFSRPVGTRGLAISASGYTAGCLNVCEEVKNCFVVFLTLEDLVLTLANGQEVAT